MRYLIILFFTCIIFSKSHSQILKDTVFIQFNLDTDTIKYSKDKKIYILLENELYKQELKEYKKYKQELEESSMPPPSIYVLEKPSKYYEFFLIEDLKKCSFKLCSKLKQTKDPFYKRQKLNELNPYKKRIIIVKNERGGVQCYLVSFFANIRE